MLMEHSSGPDGYCSASQLLALGYAKDRQHGFSALLCWKLDCSTLPPCSQCLTALDRQGGNQGWWCETEKGEGGLELAQTCFVRPLWAGMMVQPDL